MNESEAQYHAQIIFNRIKPWFKRIPNTRYRIIVVNDTYDECYNFYIEIMRKQTLTRLVPLHEVDDYVLDDLALVMAALNQNCQLPTEFRNFSNAEQKLLNRYFHY